MIRPKSKLELVSCNFRGLCDPLRAKIVKNWVVELKLDIGVLCLQEAKTDGFKLKVVVETILPRYGVTMSPSMDGKGRQLFLCILI